MKSQSGVTLIELMVSVAVLAILLAVGVPSFANYVDRARVRGAADDVVSLVQRARTESVRMGVPVSIASAGDEATWCVGALASTAPALGSMLPSAAVATTCDCSTAGACMVNGVELVVSSATYAGVTVDAIVDADDGFVVDPRLGVLADTTLSPAIQFTSKSGRFQLEVNVSPMGQARACTPDGKPTIPGYSACL
jgi:type IV fimbrial biogenesis protein FimT